MSKGQIPSGLLRAAAGALWSAGLDPGAWLPWAPGLAGWQNAHDPSLLDHTYLDSVPVADRRRRGQYYTPPWLADAILDWLDWPGAWARLVDPACGTGAFLVAAARRLAKTLEREGMPAGKVLETIVGRIQGYDTDPVAIFLCEVNLACALAGLYRRAGTPAVRWRLEVTDALNPPLAPLPPGTAVVGNPPWGARLPRVPPGHYISERESSFWFTEAIVRALAPPGRCILVLPDIILFKHYPRVRRFILEHAHIRRIALAGRAFPGVSMEAVVLDLSRSPVPGHAPVEVLVASGNGSWDRLEPVGPSAFWTHPSYKFNVLMSTEAVALKGQMEREKVPLGSLFLVHEGIHSGNVRSKLFVSSYPGPEGRPLIFGRRELQPFVIRWEGRYVRYDPGLVSKTEREYASLGREAHLKSPKVLVRRTGDRLMAAYDRQGLFPSNNFFYCLPRPDSSLAPEILTALLNSRLLGDYLRLVHPIARRVFAEVKIMQLRDLPLPVPGDPRLMEVQGDLLTIHRQGEAGEMGPSAAGRLEEVARYIYGLSCQEASEVRRMSLALSVRKPGI
ncbi:MAG: TaqI-like C-terminal specificity domain-containing protein [Bacillota bacterium]